MPVADELDYSHSQARISRLGGIDSAYFPRQAASGGLRWHLAAWPVDESGTPERP